MLSRGVIYIALGEKALVEQKLSSENIHYPIHVLDRSEHGQDYVKGSRDLKTRLYWLSPFDLTLYLDADTRVLGNIEHGFEIIDNGWDLAMSFSIHQEDDAYWHLEPDEKLATQIVWLGLQMQAGMMFFRKCDRVRKFWEVWRKEWQRWGSQDQGAFVRALSQRPVRLWLLGRPWSNGSVISHRFGALRE